MADRLSVARSGQPDRTLYTVLLDNAFNRAVARDRKISDAVLSMQGMSGISYRILINNLVASVPAARYLEIGSWMGSTACSAMEGNRLRILCIDNWSEFEGPKEAFMANTSRCITRNVHFDFIEKDFKAVDYSAIGTFNIYLFDGPHSPEDHFAGLSLPLPALDDDFFFIVDDWNWAGVRAGTFDAIASTGLSIISSIEVRTTEDDRHAEIVGESGDWHNGYFLAVLRKPRVGQSFVPQSVAIRSIKTTLAVLAHIQDQGDTLSDLDGWAGIPGSKRAVEGFSILESAGALAVGLTCQAVLPDGSLSRPYEIGEFCGTRGLNTPVCGVRLHAGSGAGAAISCEAWFVGGEKAGPVPAGDICSAKLLAPLEAFRIIISPDLPA